MFASSDTYSDYANMIIATALIENVAYILIFCLKCIHKTFILLIDIFLSLLITSTAAS